MKIRVISDSANATRESSHVMHLAEAGVAFWPSAANYVFCYFPDPTATEKALRAEGDTPSPAAQTDARQRP